MKENESLKLSVKVQELMDKNLSAIFYEYFPFELISSYKQCNSRDRVYNQSNTLLTMISAMVQSDKSLQNSVNIFNSIHDRNRKIIEELEESIKKKNLSSKEVKRGRPAKRSIKIQKSKTEDLSRNTSAYTQARQRLNLGLLRAVYQSSTKINDKKKAIKFYGKTVYIVDGTYLQLQDTPEVRKQFRNSTKSGYPRGLLEVMIQQGSGIISDFVIESDEKSELELLSRMIPNIKANSLLLADDFYNSFAIFSILKEQGVDIIVPGKRKRTYTVIQKLSEGDEIVSIKSISSKSKLSKMLDIQEQSIEMRRIQTKNPNYPEDDIILYTSLLDNKISKEEILIKYLSRWDIEISIREIKSIMKMNIIRGKSPDIIIKEVTSGLIAYNYIRSIIAKTATEADFSPEGDIFQKFYQTDNPVLLDKLGRVYSKWSPGRNGKINASDKIP